MRTRPNNNTTLSLTETELMVHELFEIAAANHDETVAVIYNEVSITYRELNLRATNLSHYLLRNHPDEEIIAVSATRSIEMIISVLAVLKAGKAYLPLDLTYPAQRLNQIREDSGVKSCLALASESNDFNALGITVVASDDDYTAIDVIDMPYPQNINACVLYTSGSTGKPKGVCLGHAGLTNFLLWQRSNSLNGQGIHALQFCHLSFDASFMEIFVSLTNGGTLYLINENDRLDGSRLLHFLIEKEIHKIFLPYVTLQYLTEAAAAEKVSPQQLREVTTGGELLKITPTIRTFFSSVPEAVLINIYGPTETTICVTTLKLTGDATQWASIPTIGTPMAGSSIYFLDEDLQLQDKDKSGELCISGPGLANGYLHQPELTAEKFIEWAHPVNGKTRLYRTGDLGKFLDNGEIEFEGRKDGQVKIRGNRVELGEIEIAINQQAGIEQVVVVLREDQPGRKNLVAYLVGDQNKQNSNSLREIVKGLLPDYMVPSNFIWMEVLPKTTSGKIDKAALPRPDSKRPDLNVFYKKPSSDLERKIASLLEELLQYDRIGIDDNFFELGGNSLLAQKTIAEIRYRFNAVLPITKLYQYPTIAGMAGFLEKKSTARPLVQPVADKTDHHADIAVIGMAGRFPGADTVPAFWELLTEGRETTSFFSEAELDNSIPDQLRKDPSYVKARGILKGVDQFDPLFFGINPKLASLMDPQQRVFLELAYEVLEQNRHLPSKYAGRIGVFAGNGNNTYYENNVLKHQDLIENVGKLQVLTVNEKDYLASRTAYHLDLKGPAVSVNSACSTSLLAIAEAVNSIRSGQCEAAVAGASSITVPVNSGHLYQEGSMLSANGHCRPFDNEATGTVFSDGAGVVLLKRLDQAILDGDTVYAVIKGVGVNNDGSGKGSFTAPSADGQSAAIKAALKDAMVTPSEISYVEAHGTGTPIGDPIEFEGLTDAFGQQPKNQFCAIGSVKSNFGHLTQAAGVAGFIKTCLSLYHQQIPATIGFKTPNQNIDFKNSPFYVNDRLTEWKTDRKRIAGVSSFGVGGTNVHVIVEEYRNKEQVSSAGRPFELITWSAQSENSLNKYEEALEHYVQAHPLANLSDIAYSLQTSRTDLRFRKFLVADTSVTPHSDAFAKALAQQAELKEIPGEMVFTFPGQGAQYLHMASDLYQQEPVYKNAVDECAGLLDEYLDRDIRTVIFPENTDDAAEKRLKDTKYTQPALFVTEYALARLWMHWGIRPALFCGHSIGEYVAAHLAGVFSLKDGLKLIATRGLMVSQMPPGSMLSVRADAKQLLSVLPDTLSLAAINTSMLSVVAGPKEAIAEFSQKLDAMNMVNKLLFTSHAFHSSMMDPIVDRFRAVVADIPLSPPSIPIVSTVTGVLLKDEEATDPDYWAGHLRQPVRFNDAIETILKEYQPLFLEVGPGTAASTMIRQIAALKSRQVKAISSLNNNENDYRSVLNALGQLWLCGQIPDFRNFYLHQKRLLLILPAYQFNRTKYWVNAAAPITTLPPAVPVQLLTEPELQETIDTPAMNKNNLTLKIKKVLEDASGIEMDHVQDDSNFIEIGLDSLLLTQVAISLKKEFNLPVTFRKLNEEYSTISLLTDYIYQNTAAENLPAAQHISTQPVQPAYNPAFHSNGVNDTALGLITQQLEILSKQIMLMQGGNPILNHHAVSPAVVASRTDAPVKDAFSELSVQEKSEISKPFGATPKIERNAAELNEKQLIFLSNLTKRYNQKTAKSKEYAAESRSYMADPRVVSGFKPLTKELVYPIVINRSSGSKMWDIDGNEYIDVLNGFGSNLLGYQPEVIRKAMHDQIDRGYEVGPQHELAAEVSKMICEFTGFDRSALCSTGSEAVLGCIRIARTVTGRSLIVAFTGSYHGIIDEVLVRGTKKLKSFPAAAGIMPEAVQNILVLDYGTDEALAIIKERANEIAAVLIEPVQSRRPEFVPLEFIKEVRKITENAGAALIFDEVITGFRMHPGGAQALFNVRADLASYGKVVGAGIPIGVIAGRKQFMDALDGGTWNYGDQSFPEVGVTYFAGTFVRHPLALASTKASLTYMKEKGPQLQSKLNEAGDHIAETLNKEIKKRQLPFFIANYGSLWKVKFHEEVPYSELMFTLMREKGIHILDGFPCFVTEATSEQDINTLIRCFTESMDEMINAGFFARNETPDTFAGADAIVTNANEPPVAGARLGKDLQGNPAWFIKDPDQDGKYLQIGI